ncbi:MAG: S26 family signal peptidase [Haloarculaceae archaeon]
MRGPGDDDGSRPADWLRWFVQTDDGTVSFVREVLGSVLAVALVGMLLFAVSGLWPPMVAVESGSMNPHLQRGDLVFVMEEHRLAPSAAHGTTGVVTYQTGKQTGYVKFHEPGDVIVYRRDGIRGGTPIIHRARFWVNDSENWYDKANPDYIGGAKACELDDDPATDTGLPNCPAPHAGFITKGDNTVTNRRYDQVSGLSGIVRPSWVVGTAEVRIPYLGYVRLLFGQL